MTGAELRATREAWGWTLQEMADRLGLGHRQSVWRMEQKAEVSPQIAAHIHTLTALRECEEGR